MNGEWIKFKNSTTVIIMLVCAVAAAAIISVSKVKAETQANTSLPIFDYTNGSFLYKFQVEDRTCVLAENQDGRSQSLVCWPTTQK